MSVTGAGNQDTVVVGATFLSTAGITTNAALTAALAAARATDQNNTAASLNPTAMGSAPNPTQNAMQL